MARPGLHHRAKTPAWALAATLILRAGAAQAQADAGEALADLLFARCLPAMATGTTLNTDGLQRLDAAQARFLLADAVSYEDFILPGTSAVLQNIAPNACGVTAVSAGPFPAFEQTFRSFVGTKDDPFTLIETFTEHNGGETEHYRAQMPVGTIVILRSVAGTSGRIAITVGRLKD